MTLPDEFVIFFNNALTEMKKESKVNQFLTKIQYDYTHEKDFAYGQKTGGFLGLLIGWWKARYAVDPNQEEFMEIIDMFQEHLDETKLSVSKLKD